METILVNKVIAKDGKKPWKILDGNGVEYVTWDDALGAQAELLLNSQAEIEAEVKEKPGRDGVIFVDRLLKEIKRAEPEKPKRDPDYEPSVNFGKQVVIIRQNAWTQTNAIYEKAVDLYQWAFAQAADPAEPLQLDMQAIHAIAWHLYSSNRRPENSNMQTIAHDIETVIRAEWFPLEDREVPF